jgi:hypothetical protein
MMHPFIVPIVEGHGETEAVPLLLRRFCAERETITFLEVNKPLRVKAGSFLNDESYFRSHVLLASAKAAEESGLVVILLDCEDDCPAEVGTRLLDKARSVRSDVEYLVVLAHREYESWFIAAAKSLRGHYGLPDDLSPPSDFEAIRAAKEWLGRRMSGYDPLNHQASFTSQIDLEQASASPSFKRFRDRIHDYLNRFSDESMR